MKKEFSFPISVILMVSVMMWALGLPAWINSANAVSLTNAKDTISDSDISATANHVISYTSITAATAGQTIKIQFDPTGDLFNLGTLALADISATGMTPVAACGAGTDEVTVTVDNISPDENVILTVCAGDTVTAGAKTITLGNNKITNPNAAASYVISIGGTQADSASTRVAIIDDVVVTASVDTTLTFTISGIVAGQAINGEPVNTSAPSTATTLPFGTLVAGTPKVLGQQLAVTTNAKNGFVVTVVQDTNLISATGADIDLFQDGSAVANPTSWAAPAGTLANENTYGHYGVTSEDADLNSDEFGTAMYAGNLATSRQVFSNTGPSDGTTANIGMTRVAYKVQVSALQEAGTDYTNTLTYVATPTF